MGFDCIRLMKISGPRGGEERESRRLRSSKPLDVKPRASFLNWFWIKLYSQENLTQELIWKFVVSLLVWKLLRSICNSICNSNQQTSNYLKCFTNHLKSIRRMLSSRDLLINVLETTGSCSEKTLNLRFHSSLLLTLEQSPDRLIFVTCNGNKSIWVIWARCNVYAHTTISSERGEIFSGTFCRSLDYFVEKVF